MTTAAPERTDLPDVVEGEDTPEPCGRTGCDAEADVEALWSCGCRYPLCLDCCHKARQAAGTGATCRSRRVRIIAVWPLR